MKNLNMMFTMKEYELMLKVKKKLNITWKDLFLRLVRGVRK